MSSRQGESPEPVPWDGGPTVPEKGVFAYQWAVRHGLMWDEFLEKIAGRQPGFDPSKKTMCPLLEHCNTRCADDQKNDLRGWPLGSSDYERSCYKFREVLWCRENGGTPEEFQEVERKRLERLTNESKNRARQQRKVARQEPPSEVENKVEEAQVEESSQPTQMSLL